MHDVLSGLALGVLGVTLIVVLLQPVSQRLSQPRRLSQASGLHRVELIEPRQTSTNAPARGTACGDQPRPGRHDNVVVTASGSGYGTHAAVGYSLPLRSMTRIRA